MLMLIALSMAGTATPQESPARRLDLGASASFTATVTITRAIGVGRDLAPPPGSHAKRTATVDDAAGQPHPAIIYDFE